MKTLCFATSTRADWGLLSPVARAMSGLPDVCVRIIATNMHLMQEYGYSADEIRADGFEIDAAVPMVVDLPPSLQPSPSSFHGSYNPSESSPCRSSRRAPQG